ncbi:MULTISPECIES: bifunctional 4-hydroxy-2-oxoglutarate aldolase/2-dehydro-3-deoxy-phosphogluconate aldolase [Vogesella]|jgi:2-dehydro-3-deoxyphosphogluconate aldolase/(4S)-4-hydroxy-2-oxoglutarate aldolase|uniref:2-dehydro-3-deoxy-phosphogluconate aldolase n=2 Tax=Vogesella TaxID=57739 RepID=A0A495BK84_VOGIN|nr:MULTISPECIES: bifunctional 4-hydroxy-2-oxoglutarate aldolase/2-dehydro-3-deoxy-phosphogluconate aldolase [Vogesella]MDC7689378.1 bifunctional 4-hydroxy-2-oxoglutarate aldolase/2-dehydro-3-deoxy-phosphogluconate aldolase [Vogesella indigofera]MDC7701153.1 bifunctional 4-hydroxy-2-oxoglutarate aldolase/2-dehydro-3-deoxy-phosphogluconate aldolase [Vogesella indigofera]MDC7709516.1 bifunctional 4-hydroxy-2-oxoglutarate aldolase/2-dehydro-3-deoxy-phosphogluconate aldolase [Vogesella indigofera]RK
MDALTLLRQGPVMPVIVVNDAAVAVDLARALVAGGIRTLEITLRTKAALAAMRRIRDEVPDAIVGAGTVRTRAHLEAALDAGAQFGISPGLTPELAAAARASGVPFIPGVATPSEAMHAQDEGFNILKLFPAEAVGGIKLLKALAGPLPELRFCPTGGIDINSAPNYLALPNVLCVGGSWLTPDDAIAAQDWARITALAQQASALAVR